MKAFSQLYQTLDQTTSTNAKVQAMAEYFAAVNDSDAAWAVYFLSGRRLKRLITASVMRKWLVDEASLPEWLVEESYSSVGDLAETNHHRLVAVFELRPMFFTQQNADWWPACGRITATGCTRHRTARRPAARGHTASANGGMDT